MLTIAVTMVQLTSAEIDRYWQAIKADRQLGIRRGCYVETDVTGKQRLKSLPPDASDESWDPFGGLDFSLDLRVRTVVEKKQDKAQEEELQEKVEHYGVLEGVLKYAGSHDQGSHVLLVGKPGSGKTTALERLLVQQELIEGRLPVLVRLRDLDSKAADPVLAEVRRVLQRWTLTFTSEQVEALVAEQLFLLLDGVNELPTLGIGGELRRDVQRFRERFQNTPMVFTTRELNVGVDLGIAKKLQMEPLSSVQMEKFARLHLGEVQGKALLKQLGGRLREFGETPLLLWMLCWLFQQVGEIPRNLGQVFRRFVELYDTRIKGFDDARRSWQGRFLQALALRMMPQNGDPFGLRLGVPRREAEDLLADVLQVAPDVAITRLDQLLSEHLLQLRGTAEVEFKHQLFQEYFAAEGLLAHWGALSDLVLQKHYLNLLDWSETLALVAGLLDSEIEALRLVRLGLAVDLYWGARLAGEVRSEFQHPAVALVLGCEVSELLRVELLGCTGSEAALPFLLKALEDQNFSVRRQAVDAIVKVGGEAALPALIKALDDEDSWVRRQAVDAIVKVGGEAALPALIKALENEDSWVRRQAIEAIGKIGGEGALPALLKALEDQNWSVRKQAVEAIGKIGGKGALPALLKALGHENSDVRKQAVEAIGKIGGEGALPDLLKALEDQNGAVRYRAARAIGKIGGEAALPGLLKALDDQDWEVSQQAAEAIGKIGGDAALPALIKALDNKHSDVRYQVVEAIGKIGGEAVLPVLIKALDDEDSWVRRSAVEAIGKIGKPRILKQLWQYPLQADRLDVLPAIFGIQDTCKIYNYDISQTPLPAPISSSEPTIINNFNAPVGQANTGTVNIQGDNIGTQNHT